MENKNWMPKIDLFPRITAVGRFIGSIVTAPHLLASHGDHFTDSLASPIEPVTSWPHQAEILQLFPYPPEDAA